MSTRTLPHRPLKPKHHKPSSAGSSDFPPTKPYSHFFCYTGQWSPSPQLRAFAGDCPDALVLWSLNSRRDGEEEVLVCNLVQGEGKDKLRRRLWPGEWRVEPRWRPSQSVLRIPPTKPPNRPIACLGTR
jgi:hypothetical protein